MPNSQQPCAVVMVMRDGSTVEQVYASRYQAERFLHRLPLLMSTLPHDDQVASAILSPLVEQRSPAPPGLAAPRHLPQ